MPNRTLEIVAITVLVLWLLGWLVVPVGGELIHFLLVILLLVVIVRLVRGQSPIP